MRIRNAWKSVVVTLALLLVEEMGVAGLILPRPYRSAKENRVRSL